MTIDHRETTRFERYAAVAAVTATGVTSAAIANDITISGATTGNGTFTSDTGWSLLVTGNGGSVTLSGDADVATMSISSGAFAGAYLAAGTDHVFMGRTDFYSRRLPYGLDSGDTIANAATLAISNSGILGFEFEGTNIRQSAGDWVNTAGQAVTSFLGFRVGSGPSARYGWAEILLDLDANGTSQLTFIDSYLGAAGDTTVAAGQTAPSNAVPGLGGIAALACGAAGLRRRRQRIA